MKADGRQATLDDYIPKHTCTRCGKTFQTEKGLRIHLAHHYREDIYTVITFLRHPDFLTEKEVMALAAAARLNNHEKAVAMLSKAESSILRKIAEAIKWSPEAYEYLVRGIGETGFEEASPEETPYIS